MGKKRRKNRTHVPVADSGNPKSFVIKMGRVGHSVGQLVRDMRRVMEPNTASRLKERKGNKLRDFVDVAAQLNVTHLMAFSLAEHVNLRIGRFPRGPTLTFQIEAYSLSKDVLALQKRPKSPDFAFQTSPLVVLNNFTQEKHMKLMASSFQNLFPAIRVNQMKLSDARRIILINYNSDKDLVQIRHYSINVKQVGMSKSIKTLVNAQIPNLAECEDIADYVLRGAYASESDMEDAIDSTMTLPPSQNQSGESDAAAVAEKRAIRLTELGPRVDMRLVKIEENLCSGAVIYHAFKSKTGSS